MNVIERAKSILLKPEETWPVIDAEACDGGLHLPAVVDDHCRHPRGMPAFHRHVTDRGGCIRLQLPHADRRPAVGSRCSATCCRWSAAFLLALLVDALAPTFGGTKNQVAALKVVAYGLAASCVAGVLLLVPSFLADARRPVLAAGCYGIYVFNLGTAGVDEVPAGQGGRLHGGRDQSSRSSCTAHRRRHRRHAVRRQPAVRGWPARHAGFREHQRQFDGLPGHASTRDAIAAMAKRMDAARARIEAAQKSGDPASAGAALGEMMGALTGAGGTPIPPADLKAQLPETLGALKRESFETNGGSAVGISSSSAKAGLRQRRPARAAVHHRRRRPGRPWHRSRPGPTSPWTRRRRTRSRRSTSRTAARSTSRTARTAATSQVTVILKNGVIVDTSGDKIDGPTLKAMASAVNLDAIEGDEAARRSREPSLKRRRTLRPRRNSHEGLHVIFRPGFQRRTRFFQRRGRCCAAAPSPWSS